MKITHKELFLYLADELSADERVAFEKALEQSPEAQQALAELQEQERQLKKLPLQEPSRDLVAAALESVRPKSASVFWLPAPWLAAAAALLLLAGGAFWMLATRDSQTLMATGPSPVPSAVPIGDDELETRIAQLRSAMMKAPVPAQRSRAAVIPDPAPALMAGVKTRLSDLQARCRPQMTSVSTAPAPGKAPMDRRINRIKSGMDFIREDIWATELPTSVQAALDKVGSMWPALPLSTIISPVSGVSHSEGRRIPSDCAVSLHQWKERKIT